MVKEIESKEDFEKVLLEAGDKLVVVDFTASWCPPCKRIAPEFERLSQKYPDVVFVKVDVDKCRAVASANGVSAMPTFKFFKGGTLYYQFSGASVSQLEEGIKTYSREDAEPDPKAGKGGGSLCVLS